MKKIVYIGFLTLVLIMIVSGCSNSSSNTSKSKDGKSKIDLIASSGLSDQHILFVKDYKPIMDRVEEETENQVEFTAYTSGELVPLGEEYQALEQGSIDIALSFMTQYDAKKFPYMEVTLLPALYSDVSIATEAANNLMNSDVEILDGKTIYELEFEDKGLVAFPNIPTEAYVIATNGAKFEKVEDFNKKIQIRSSSRIHNMLADNLGISATSMPITDAFDALSRKTIDGLLYNIPDWKSLGFSEIMKYTIEGTSFGHFFQQTVMLEETWNSLPSEVQDIYRSAQEDLLFNGVDLTKEDTEIVKNETIQNGGEFIDFNDLNEPVKEHIESAIVETWNDWIEDLEQQGLPGKKAAMLWRDLVIEAGGEFPQEIIDLK